jgi:hypothetical protein
MFVLFQDETIAREAVHRETENAVEIEIKIAATMPSEAGANFSNRTKKKKRNWWLDTRKRTVRNVCE